MAQALTLALFVMVAAPLFAQQHQSGDQPMAQQMEKMHSHMQTMQEQMKEIKATKDSEQRKALMQQHRQSMREAMMMMGNMDKGPMSKGGTQQKHQQMSCADDDAQCQRMQSMEDRQAGMQERMQMMQMMMQQMMEHQSAQADQQ
ncbi:MAG TPA: hypothetical protein PKK10_17745 [Woeseiaceae bacterium]|nr:hypothetical protein [Woeseiaceae bacterium]